MRLELISFAAVLASSSPFTLKPKPNWLPFLLNSAKHDQTARMRMASCSWDHVPQPFGRGVSSREPGERARAAGGTQEINQSRPDAVVQAQHM